LEEKGSIIYGEAAQGPRVLWGPRSPKGVGISLFFEREGGFLFLRGPNGALWALFKTPPDLGVEKRRKGGEITQFIGETPAVV